GTERLVHQQDGRFVGERPRDADPLLHATGKLGRIAMSETGKADHIEQLVGQRARPGPSFPLGIGTECDVLPDRLPREQRVLLEHHATIGTGADNLISVDPDPSGGRANIAGDRVEQCGFAATRGTEQTHKGAGSDVDGRVFQRVNGLGAAAKLHRHVPNLDAPLIERGPNRRKARHIDGRRSREGHYHNGARAVGISITGMVASRELRPDNWRRRRIALVTSVDSPSSDSQPPRGCNASAVVTPTPITARPTIHVGAAQHTTQVMVVAAAPATSAPAPVPTAEPSRAETAHVFLAARSSTRLVATSAAIASTTMALP